MPEPKTTKKAAAKKTETPEERRARLEEKQTREREARIQAANEQLEALQDSVTQREWLLICKRLDVTKDQIGKDTGLRLLALAWVKQKREHGGAEWDKLLEAKDNEILGLLGFDADGNPVGDSDDVQD